MCELNHTFSSDGCLCGISTRSTLLLSTVLMRLHTAQHFGRSISIIKIYKIMYVLDSLQWMGVREILLIFFLSYELYFRQKKKNNRNTNRFIGIWRNPFQPKHVFVCNITFPEVLFAHFVNKSGEWFTIVYFGRRL